jgi:hypothetical protein
MTHKPENEWIEGNWRARTRFILRVADRPDTIRKRCAVTDDPS